jgi:serine/threonine-protein kinase
VIRKIDRYELLERVGSGGMAVVYRGRDSILDREVALKLLHPHLAERVESQARFSREARAVARLAHPNILEIYDYAGGADDTYLVTEFVRGRTLRAYAEQVGMGFPEVGVLVARALADAVAHAHGAGVIHRDIKPENVLVCEVPGRRSVKLADFGIARIMATEERMTMTGALVGSPNHMAPEIIDGRDADSRSDVFSLGTLVYWLATGDFPFAAANPTATLRRVLDGEYQDPRLSSPLVSDGLAQVIQRALALDPDARYRSAAELRAALDEVLAAVGLARPEEELTAFLEDPEGYKASFPARLVASLMTRGEAALRQGATARALSCFNRILILEPENQRVQAELDRMTRRARAKSWARRGALALLVLSCLGGAALVVRSQVLRRQRLQAEAAALAPAPTPSQPPAATPEPAALSSPAARAEPVQAATGPKPSSSGPARSEPEPPHPAAPHPRRERRGSSLPVTLSVHVRPYAQRALLDGTEVARGQQRIVFSLAPDRPHVIQIEHACCSPFVKTIEPAEAARLGELKVPLVPRPARLRVEAPAETRVYLNDRLVGTAADTQREPIPVPVPQSADNPYEGKAELRLEQSGRPPYSAEVTVRAGGDITVAAPQAEGSP